MVALEANEAPHKIEKDLILHVTTLSWLNHAPPSPSTT